VTLVPITTPVVAPAPEPTLEVITSTNE
jgi:hypothetical protein